MNSEINDLYFEDYDKSNSKMKNISNNSKIFKAIHDLWLYSYNELNECPLSVNYALMLGINTKIKEVSDEYNKLINEAMINIYYKLCHEKINISEFNNKLVIQVIKAIYPKIETFENLLYQDINIINTIHDIYHFKNKNENKIITRLSLINLIYIIFNCILENDEDFYFDDLIYKMEDEHIFIDLSHKELTDLIDEIIV